MRKILIGLPAMSGTMHIATMRSILAETINLLHEGWIFEIYEVCGCSLMEDARNLILSKFLGTQYDDLIFVDSDVSWEYGAMVRLLKHPVGVVAAAYRHRADPVSWPVKWLDDRKELWADPDTGLLEVEGVPAGFLRISRDAALKITANAEWYHDKQAPDQKSWMVFDRIRDDQHQKWGEDFSFCKRWRDLGEKVWLDPEIRMAHIGNKTFDGQIGDWLRAR